MLSERQKADFLAGLSESRRAICLSRAKLRPASPHYGDLGQLLGAIDALAEAWTGDHAFFHTRPHSSDESG